MTRTGSRHVVVVGAGISGLAAAWRLRGVADVTVLEATGMIGGKLRLGAVAGHVVDVGAEMVLARVPEAVDLVRAVGLEPELVHPATTAAQVLVEGVLHPLPGGTVLGVPTDAEALTAILPAASLEAIRREPELAHPPLVDDVAVGSLLRRRLGDAVVDRLVDPLLGGVYAGRADALSLQATVPGLAAALVTDGSVVRAARAAADSGASTTSGPVFASLRGGLGQLPPAVAAASGAHVLTGVTVRRLEQTADGWSVVAGPTTDEVRYDADAVVLAVPAPAAARLVDSAALAAVELASTALITLAFPRSALPNASGVLVPEREGLTVKAITWSSRKWSHLPADVTLVRASIGRAGDVAALQRSDDELVAAALADVRRLGGPAVEPVDAVVTRWGGGLPQYAVGHLDLVASVRAGLPSGLAVCGAAYDGVGVPACIRSGFAAAVGLSEPWQ